MSLTETRVRVVESDPARAVMLSEWLSDCFETSVTTSGTAALEAVDEDTDILVVPQQLADMRAGELLEGLRADGNDCQVVLLSEGGVISDYEGEGFGRVIEWPLGPERLRKAVDDLVFGTGAPAGRHDSALA